MIKTDEQIILETIKRTRDMIIGKKTKKEQQDEIVREAHRLTTESSKGCMLSAEQKKIIDRADSILESRMKYSERKNKHKHLKHGLKFMLDNEIPCICWKSNGYEINIACAPSKVHVGSHVYSMVCKSKKDKSDNKAMMSLLGMRLNDAVYTNLFFNWHTDAFSVRKNATIEEELFFAYMSFVRNVMFNDCDMSKTVFDAAWESISDVVDSSFEAYLSNDCIL